MNIEAVLRKRARACRVCAAIGWGILFASGYFYVGSNFFSLKELLQGSELRDVWMGGFNANLLTIILPGFLVFSGLVYLFTKFCYFLNLQADRYTSLADALCLSGSSLSELEKAIKITTHNADSLSMSDMSSDKDIKALIDLIKGIR